MITEIQWLAAEMILECPNIETVKDACILSPNLEVLQ